MEHDIHETPFVTGTDVIGDVMAQWLDSDEGRRLRQRWLDDDAACAARLAMALELLVDRVRTYTAPPLSSVVNYYLWCSLQKLATYYDMHPLYGWVTDMTTTEEGS